MTAQLVIYLKQPYNMFQRNYLKHPPWTANCLHRVEYPLTTSMPRTGSRRGLREQQAALRARRRALREARRAIGEEAPQRPGREHLVPSPLLEPFHGRREKSVSHNVHSGSTVLTPKSIVRSPYASTGRQKTENVPAE